MNRIKKVSRIVGPYATARPKQLHHHEWQMGVEGVSIFRKKRYEGIRFNVISVTKGWVGVQFPEKKCYVTLEWPLRRKHFINSPRLLACSEHQMPARERLSRPAQLP